MPQLSVSSPRASHSLHISTLKCPCIVSPSHDTISQAKFDPMDQPSHGQHSLLAGGAGSRIGHQCSRRRLSVTVETHNRWDSIFEPLTKEALGDRFPAFSRSIQLLLYIFRNLGPFCTNPQSLLRQVGWKMTSSLEVRLRQRKSVTGSRTLTSSSMLYYKRFVFKLGL